MEIYTALTDRLNTQHLAIATIIYDVSEKKLLSRPETGKWSIQENIAHLTRYQSIFIARINKILQEQIPVFDRYSADTDEVFKAFITTPTTNLLKTYQEDRLIINQMINDLHAEALARTGEHPVYGRLTILKWAEFFVLHEAHHLFTIFQLVNNNK